MRLLGFAKVRVVGFCAVIVRSCRGFRSAGWVSCCFGGYYIVFLLEGFGVVCGCCLCICFEFDRVVGYVVVFL